MTAHILVVESELSARKHIKSALEQKDYSLTMKSSFDEALSYVKHQGEGLDVLLICLPPGRDDGLAFIRGLANLGLSAPIIALLAQGDIGEVAELMRAGTFDFIVRPASQERIVGAIENALKVSRAGRTRLQRRSRPTHVQFSHIISASQPMMRVVALARKAAHNHIPVVLEGESGVGKTLIARAIHSASERASRPFVVVDCHAFAAAALSSHGRGLTASLAADWQAKIQEAEGATLYLKEVGDLPAKL